MAKKKSAAGISESTLNIRTLAAAAILAGAMEAAAGGRNPMTAYSIDTGVLEAFTHNKIALTGAVITVRALTATAGAVELLLVAILDDFAPAAVLGTKIQGGTSIRIGGMRTN